MKKLFVVLVLSSSFLLAGCSLQDLKDRVAGVIDTIVQQDQQNEQGFMLTSTGVYEAFYPDRGYIDLAGKGLTSVPDLCTLLYVEDHPLVIDINLMENDIRVINTDLSCLTNLKTLNLSYNQIVAVQTLGSLPSLEELYLQQNAIETTEDFPNFPGLRRLSLGFNKLKEVKDIDHLTSLIALELHHNVLEKLDGIQTLDQLKELKVEFNKLSDKELNPVLGALEKLELVTAKGNQLKEDLLGRLNALNKAWVEKNILEAQQTGTTGPIQIDGVIIETSTGSGE